MLKCIRFIVLSVYLSYHVGGAARLLCLFPYVFPSPFKVITPFVKELHENGHELTIVSPVEVLSEYNTVRHILVQGMQSLTEDIFQEFEMPASKWEESKMIGRMFYNISRCFLSDKGVQSLLQNTSEHFDMVFVDTSHTDALFGFAKHFNAVLVGISAHGSSWHIDYLAGNSAPSVYELISPNFHKYELNLLDKFYSWVNIAEDWMIENYVFLPDQLKLYKQYFCYSSESFYDLRRSFSLILVNHHFSLGRVRSNVPNLIEVAGIHLQSPSISYNASLKRFLDEATDGVIYFSMGVEIVAKYLPAEMQDILLQTFSQLKQRVVWKYDNENLPNKTDNIYVGIMLPQREILEHHNTKLFITHGGLLSVIEAVHYGVPILGLPVYYDQFQNIDRVQQFGAALSLDVNNLSLEIMLPTVLEMLMKPQYAKNALELSRRFRDQPMSLLHTAIWWTEYVLRYEGAAHMRLSEEDISFVQYYKIDLISVMLVRICFVSLMVLGVSYKLIQFSFSIATH